LTIWDFFFGYNSIGMLFLTKKVKSYFDVPIFPFNLHKKLFYNYNSQIYKWGRSYYLACFCSLHFPPYIRYIFMARNMSVTKLKFSLVRIYVSQLFVLIFLCLLNEYHRIMYTHHNIFITYIRVFLKEKKIVTCWFMLYVNILSMKKSTFHTKRIL
jgi:hypothetical protein